MPKKTPGRGFNEQERAKIEERRQAVLTVCRAGATVAQIIEATGLCESRVRTILAQERTRIARGG